MDDNQNILSNIQPILENNEDIIAAILENVQIGRLDDCVKHYGILQSNLMSLSRELDNYPPCDVDLYSDVILNRGLFPDEIMRKDILDDLNHVRGDSKRGASAHSLPGRCPACVFAEVIMIDMLRTSIMRNEVLNVSINALDSTANRSSL